MRSDGQLLMKAVQDSPEETTVKMALLDWLVESGTEDDWQSYLDLDVEDHKLRVRFGDWLTERGDGRGEGYKALGLLKRSPVCDPCGHSLGGPKWLYTNSKSACLADIFRGCRKQREIRLSELPDVWCFSIMKNSKVGTNRWNSGAGWFVYERTCSDAESVAAVAYSKLTMAQKSEILKGLP